ncbi:hypothetical protein, partial [Paenibacillus terrae]
MMNISDFSQLENVIHQLNDDCFWKPLEESDTDKVKMFIDKIEESKTWTRSRNQEKGALLE